MELVFELLDALKMISDNEDELLEGLRVEDAKDETDAEDEFIFSSKRRFFICLIIDTDDSSIIAFCKMIFGSTFFEHQVLKSPSNSQLSSD